MTKKVEVLNTENIYNLLNILLIIAAVSEIIWITT